MENASDPMRMLRLLRGRDESRSLLSATWAESAQLWRQTGSLAAYLVIFSALDSNDDEVRHLAEESLNRSSPRPAIEGIRAIQHSGNLSGGRSQRDEE